MQKSKIGIIGAGQMGGNLAQNLSSKKIKVTIYDQSSSQVKKLIKEYGNKNLDGAFNWKDFCNSLEMPRRIILLVPAGETVDKVMGKLSAFLKKGDVIIDGGNSHFEDTERRENLWRKKGIVFAGMGISGGPAGALNGPSLMYGGDKLAWKKLKVILEKIAAKDFAGRPCVLNAGAGGAGHYVKMVHNGIEYVIMQMIAEIYDLARKGLGMDAEEVGEIFSKLNKGAAQSFLLETATRILGKRAKKGILLDKILDKAAQTGTGIWTAMEGFKQGIPVPSISEADFARELSSFKEMRVRISKNLKRKSLKAGWEIDWEGVLLFGMLMAYAQGLHLLSSVARIQKWQIKSSEVARVWQGGCIIRSLLLKTLEERLEGENLDNLIEDKKLFKLAQENSSRMREFLQAAISSEVAVPVTSSMLSYFDGMKDGSSPANLVQALRDAFGGHKFQLIDKPGFFHEDW